jgi:hypothetical protein
MHWSQAHNNTMDCVLTPVLRVSWSQPRCWHGDNVTIRVRSVYVKDGGQITLNIYAVGNVNAIDTIPNLVLNGNTLDYAYTVNWKNMVIPANSTFFEVKATLTTPAIDSPASAAMAVDLVVPVFSA